MGERGGDEGIVSFPCGYPGIGQGDAFVGIILLLSASYSPPTGTE